MKYCYFILILSYSPFLLVSFLPADFLVNPRFYFTIVNYFINNIVKTMVNAGCSLVLSSQELNSILQVRAGCGQEPPAT